MPGQQVDADQEALVRELMELSGAKDLIEHLAMYGSMLAKTMASTVDIPYEILNKAFLEAWRPGLLSRGFESYLNKNYNRAYCQQALEWFRSSLGRKITQGEVEADLPDSLAKAESYARQLERTPPTQRRMELIERLAEVSGKMESVAADQVFMTTALNPGHQFTAGELEALRKQSRDAFMMSGGPSYAYRALTSDELTKYIEFLESDAGKWCQKTILGAFKETMLTAVTELGKQLAKAGAGKGRVTKPE
jgi:hypothetical protein